MTLYWFGRSFNAPAWEGVPETPTPVGQDCAWCGEPVLDGEAGVTMPALQRLGWTRVAFHVECHLRQSLGGLAHLEGRCVCHGGTDEPGEVNMTEREEARKVVELFWGPNWMEGD